LRKRAAWNPGKAERALESARGSRQTIYRIFSAIAAGKNPSRNDFDSFNLQLSQILPKARIRRKGNRIEWGWREDTQNLDRILWPILHSAAELLTSDDRRMVRECRSETCTWLFLDRSKNKTRRWCDMKTCGNRAKWRRHYGKSKRMEDRG
jgi:predicted RNA-binding Zn ribbon-like protein